MSSICEIIEKVKAEEPVTAFCLLSGFYRNSVEYRNWKRMVKACDPKRKTTNTMCEDWLLFENFVNDMGPRVEGQKLIRLDEDEPFNKDNCVWAR